MNDVERELRALGERAGRDAAYRPVPARRIVRRARLRRAAAAVPVAAVVLVVALVYPALVPEGRESSAVRVDLAAVARATEDAESARVEMRVTMEMSGETQIIRGLGEIDFERRRSYLEIEGLASGGVVEMISIGDASYQRTRGEKWGKLDLDAGAFGTGAGPADMLPYLERTADEVTNLGEEELDGIEVTHYRAVIDAEELQGATSAELELDPIEVWVDALGRLRQMTFGSVVRTGGLEARMDMTMRLWDFGIAVDVVAPDPGDVSDEPGGLESGEASSGDVSEWGLTEATMVFGPDGSSGPHLIVVAEGSGDLGVCAQSLPLGATRLSLVDEISRRRLFVMGAGELEDHASISSSGGCARRVLTAADADALAADPTRYSLVVEKDGREAATIALEDVTVMGDD